MTWTATFSANSQADDGSIVATAVYTDGQQSITESYTDANAATVKATVNSRLAQLQAAADFVSSNAVNGTPFTSLA